jgi:hypothetical protein
LYECGAIVFPDSLNQFRHTGEVLVIIEGVSPPGGNAEGSRSHCYNPGTTFGDRLEETDPFLLKIAIFPGVKARRRACL